MSHHKHTIEAFVIQVTPSREHDARIKLVTKDGEVLTAIATGLRTLKSKLRMTIVPYALAKVSLVKGKDMWRLTNAQSVRNFFAEMPESEKRKALARTVSLVEKLTPGESHVGNIFEKLIEYAEILIKEKVEEKNDRLKAYETQAALKILAELGYIENTEKWNNADIEYINTHIKEAVQDVNHGIKSTHLM